MFTLQTKLIAGLALLALIGGLITVQHLTVKKLRVATARANQAEANYTALRQAQKHERKIANDALKDRDQRLADLETARSATPTRVVRLCHTNPAVPATTGTASGTDAGIAAEQPSTAGPDIEAGPDIGPNLYALADEADQRAAQCNALIGWVRSR
jgi:hypothetical protein